MLGPPVGQQGRLFYEFCLEDCVPADHLLRKIDAVLDLSWLRGELKAHYSDIGRPSICPELMIRMLLVGYCYSIRSERRLCQEVELNLAYRWFCRLGLEDKVPDHSTFSVNRHGRFRESDILRTVFEEVVCSCMAAGLVGGEGFAVDGAHCTRDDFTVSTFVNVIVAEEPDAVIEVMKPALARQLGGMGSKNKNFYAEFARRMGYDDKTFTAAIVNLAVKGHLVIDEDDGDYVLEKTPGGGERLAAGESTLMRRRFSKGRQVTLKQFNHKLIKSALRAHSNSLEADYEQRYFRTNALYTVLGIVISVATLAAAIAPKPS